ncbi:hypothetical protein [Allobranchiibius sp. GilTou38]|uniref:hypothetical protein n=1 Tax=Allobranchiibius sp. GilTou38 TaxID=2815210 RepID=UPI001AA1D31D|nr:hypothetical protein [Allobranchiibius sp. GilTou38]MBO1767054.1 hypothetical protein [Allobranchiibius sp. GilTou38]
MSDDAPIDIADLDARDWRLWMDGFTVGNARGVESGYERGREAADADACARYTAAAAVLTGASARPPLDGTERLMTDTSQQLAAAAVERRAASIRRFREANGRRRAEHPTPHREPQTSR